MPKERTKGQKEINKSNAETLTYYIKISIATNVIHLLYIIFFTFFNSELQIWSIFWLVIALLHHGGAEWMLNYLAKSGSDLETSWISEYSKDIIIFIGILQILSVVSNKVWILWIILPGFAFYKIWVTLLWPWFTAGSEPMDGNGGDGKKQKRPKPKKVYR